MIVPVDQTNLGEAAKVHAASWQASHQSFCTPAFVAQHTPERQALYIRQKMETGSRFYLLTDKQPIGIVSVSGSLIEDLYVHPSLQGKGYGTMLLRHAVSCCTGTPTLWVLANNTGAARLYQREGFRETGRRKAIANGIDEVEWAMNPHP